MVTLKKSTSFRGLTVVKRGKGRVLEEKCGNIVICVFVSFYEVLNRYNTVTN
jgi:hypothetical protein